ncbi:MAG: hypothetical protein ACE5K8_04230, partial [Candidatus Zixiibacteriota bacterium]
MQDKDITGCIEQTSGRWTAMNRRSGHLTVPRLSFRARAVFTLIILSALISLFANESHSSNWHDLAYVQVPLTATQKAGGEIDNTILSGRYLRGMQIVLASTEDVAADQRIVTEGFFCATDPAFSHDGSHLVFSGKRSEKDHLQIWEISRDNPEPRKVVTCDADCIQPLYLPNGHIVFASLLSREYEEHGGQYSFSLYEWAPGSDTPNRLTFNPSSEFDPTLLDDGRLLFSSWQHVGNHYWPRGNTALMLTYWDGTGIFPVTGNHRQPWLKRGAAAFGDDLIAFIQADSLHSFGAGSLVATDLNNLFAPYQPLIDPEAYSVSDVTPLPDGHLLVAARPANSPDQSFGLYVLQGKDVKPLYDDPDSHELKPSAFLPDRRPDTRFSTVVPGTPFGYLLILNCYETDRIDQKLLNSKSVSIVRVIEGIPIRHNGTQGPEFFSVVGREKEPLIYPNSATGYIPARILGEVPPASDGSVYLKVPADRPLRIQLVDREGFTIMNERAWFWVRPNERRVCIGCHENRELSPHNATPRAAQRVVTDLTDTTAWQTITFRHDIEPILTSNCAVPGCHVPPRPTAGMNLKPDQLNGDKDAVLADRFGPAYANLLKRQEGKPFSVGGRRVHPGDSRASPLLWMLYGRALGPQYAPAPFDRPINASHPGPMLPEEYLKLFRLWIDLGAIYDDKISIG